MITPLLALAAPADADVRTSIDQWIPRDPGILILIGALLVTSLAVFIWAAFFRKSPRPPHYRFRRYHPDEARSTTTGRSKFRRLFSRRRHRHHRERRRNPTLAEAGGLPPARSEEPPPSST